MNWFPAVTVWFAEYPATKILFVPNACTTTELVPKLESSDGFCAKICPATELTNLLPITTNVDAEFEFESSTASGVVAVFNPTVVTADETDGVAVRFDNPVTLQLVEENVHCAVTFAIVTFAMFVACPTPYGPNCAEDVETEELAGPTINASVSIDFAMFIVTDVVDIADGPPPLSVLNPAVAFTELPCELMYCTDDPDCPFVLLSQYVGLDKIDEEFVIPT